MKKGFNILLILCAGLFILSCSDKTKSYTDMLKDEKKAISKLIDEKGFRILDEDDFPRDSVFAENEYVKLDNGVYLRIIDKGNGNKPVLYSTMVLCRFTADRITIDADNPQYMKNVSNYGPNSGGTYPLSYRYGTMASSEQFSQDDYRYYVAELLGEALAEGLNYVSERGKVSLIVPFKRGGSRDMDNGWPVYFEIVEYKFE